MKGKIGVGIITCNRPELFTKCIASIPEADYNIVINDGSPYPDSMYPGSWETIIQNEQNIGVGKSKNKALRYLMTQKCEHIFLCEDDIMINDQNIFDHYIRASGVSGIQHLNYAYHGPANRTPAGDPDPRKVVQYKNISISLNRNIYGAFSYYSRRSLETVGLIDECYKNAWEHVDHTYQIIKKNMHPPFWWFADVADSYNLISDLHKGHSASIIRKNPLWQLRKKYNTVLFKLKNKCYPGAVPDTDEHEVMLILDQIKSEYSNEL